MMNAPRCNNTDYSLALKQNTNSTT